jgi:hypothetical protein
MWKQDNGILPNLDSIEVVGIQEANRTWHEVFVVVLWGGHDEGLGL